MSFDLRQIKEAYIKLKSYIYYDNTDILLRKQLVEFESDITNDVFSLHSPLSQPYNFHDDIFGLDPKGRLDKKLQKIAEHLNSYHQEPEFFDFFLEQVTVSFYPKKIAEGEILEKNFITNKRVERDYPVERVTAFINAPIELHILAVLWILEFGVAKDAKLKSSCLGNRLLLNKDRNKIVKGSGLFKPYFKQYQKWRDEAVDVAKELLEKSRDVLFLNLDIKDYFHSVRINTSELFPNEDKDNTSPSSSDNLQNIFLKIHKKYTELVSKKYQSPYNFYDELIKEEGKLKEVMLPIGLLSSYVLANDFLKKFDKRIVEKIKPAYYGRYVDDILIVISDPNPSYNKEETDQDVKFSFQEYAESINSKKQQTSNEKVSFKEEYLTPLERFVLENFYPVIKLIDSPAFLKSKRSSSKPTGKGKVEKSFKLCGYKSLYFQSDKSLIYFFDHRESDMVIDKLKKELDERTSEFRDFPDEESNNSFEESAYHLLYDGSEGKIRTLKDYKEDRYGLTVYLSNKIFCALRHEKKVSEKEKNQVLKFFRGSNCINFYRLWERIFTFLLVNEQPHAYVKFYFQCQQQIEKISSSNSFVEGSKVDAQSIKNTLFKYLDGAHELALSLNPLFIIKAKEAALSFEFEINKLKGSLFSFLNDFDPTKPEPFYLQRFRKTNMIRHQYVVHPLYSYTESSKNSYMDLTSLGVDFERFSLDSELKKNSPRPVKFLECCLAIAFEEIATFKNKERDGDYVITDLLGITSEEGGLDGSDVGFQPGRTSGFYLEKAFDLFKEINQNHIPTYILEAPDYRKQFYTITPDNLEFDKWPELNVLEITVNSNNKNNLKEPRIAFANTEVDGGSILKSLRGTPNLSMERYMKLAGILKKARKEESDILLFPESFIPINLLSSLVRFSAKNQVLTVTGLEHLTVENAAFNFIVTILPLEVNGIKDAVVVFRLKNHYSHAEEHLIHGNHLTVPKPRPYRYDIFNWKNVYFSNYYCFELTNAAHRSLFKGKIDLLIGVEWNRDTPYFANIVETSSRDLHVYIAQVNTSQFGDTRLSQPVETARKDILRLKGGINDTILVAKIDIHRLREFQRQKFPLTNHKKEFKPLPPDFLLEDVLKRIRNQSVIKRGK